MLFLSRLSRESCGSPGRVRPAARCRAASANGYGDGVQIAAASPATGVIPRAANYAGKGELRRCGAYSLRCRNEAGQKTSVWVGSDEASRDIRFPLVRTGNARSAARAQARLRPNLRARLQLTSSWPSRSRDSRLLPMVGGRTCQRIKIYVVNDHIEAGFLASGLQVFRIVSRRGGMAVWRRGVGILR